MKVLPLELKEFGRWDEMEQCQVGELLRLTKGDDPAQIAEGFPRGCRQIDRWRIRLRKYHQKRSDVEEIQLRSKD